MSVKTQKSELFFVDALSASVAAVMKMVCPTGITGLGFTTAERSSSCLNETISRSRPGKRTLSAFQVPFRLTAGSQAHAYLLNLSKEGVANTEVPFAIALSDGTADPSLTAGAFVAPGTSPNFTRTVAIGSLYVGGVTIDMSDGEDVLGTFTAMPQSLEWFLKPAA